MTTCKLAALSVAFDNRYSYLPHLMRDYLTEEPPLLTLSVTDEEILRETEGGRFLPSSLSQEDRMAYLESLALYRKLSSLLPLYGGFFLHSALLSVHGEGIAVAAASGVGKSTHAALWRQYLGDDCLILNGDKPLLRRGEDGRFYGYGTPFAGKEGWHRNASAPMRTLLLLERGSRDRLTPLTPAEAFPALYASVLSPGTKEAAAHLLPLLSDFLTSVQIFRAEVTPAQSAAEVAYHTIFKKEISL